MAIMLKRPNTARARPSSLIKRDDEYKKLFTREHPIETYRVCVQIVRQAEAFLDSLPIALAAADKNNLKFYVAMAAAHEAVGKYDPTAKDLATLAGNTLDDNILSTAFNLVSAEYEQLGKTDQVAKGADFVARVRQRLREKFPPPGPQ